MYKYKMYLTKHEFSCSLPTLGRINALQNIYNKILGLNVININ